METERLGLGLGPEPLRSTLLIFRKQLTNFDALEVIVSFFLLLLRLLIRMMSQHFLSVLKTK